MLNCYTQIIVDNTKILWSYLNKELEDEIVSLNENDTYPTSSVFCLPANSVCKSYK